MILPIIAYGNAVLRKVGQEIDKDYPDLKELIANMYETMYNARGIGLAAPQIGKAIRIFLVDTKQMLDEDPENDSKEKGIKQTFINAKIIEKSGKEWVYNEGCLSIPAVNEDVVRQEKVKIQYYDEDFNFHEKEFDGMNARVILHEYDHIEGILFLDYLSALKKRLLKRKLTKITKGDTDAHYRMKFPNAKKKR